MKSDQPKQENAMGALKGILLVNLYGAEDP
ncbi:hypothetical protein N824_29590 [Pedobacter sp. V48]|nr:hypothetical protein N824_29590 [Pedobacter sp. V48]